MYDELTGISQVSFKWNSGIFPTYTNWAASQPEIHRASDNFKCVSFYKNDRNILGEDEVEVGQWAVTQCDYKLSYVCKKPMEKNPPTTVMIQTPGCPPVCVN